MSDDTKALDLTAYGYARGHYWVPKCHKCGRRFEDADKRAQTCERCAMLACIERLERELAEARRDAERYKWLRDRMTHEQSGPHFGWTFNELCPGDDPDTAIDAGMKGASDD